MSMNVADHSFYSLDLDQYYEDPPSKVETDKSSSIHALSQSLTQLSTLKQDPLDDSERSSKKTLPPRVPIRRSSGRARRERIARIQARARAQSEEEQVQEEDDEEDDDDEDNTYASTINTSTSVAAVLGLIQDSIDDGTISLDGNGTVESLGVNVIYRTRANRGANRGNQGGEESNDTALNLICPLTKSLPIHPVMASDGRVYEGSALDKYIQQKLKQKGIPTTNNTTSSTSMAGLAVKSPVTKENMSTTYVESIMIRNLIEKLIHMGTIPPQGKLAKNWTKVTHLLKQAQQLSNNSNNNLEKMHEIAYSYLSGKNDFPEDPARAYQWAKKAHTLGYIPSTSVLAVMLVNGKGVPKNVPLGVLYMGIAAQGGNDYAAYNLGKGFACGSFGGLLGVDHQEAIKWLRLALSGNCKYKLMSSNAKQKAQDILDELLLNKSKKQQQEQEHVSC